jgi:integrase
VMRAAGDDADGVRLRGLIIVLRAPWLTLRSTLPVGALFCVLRGPTRARRSPQPKSAFNYTTRPAAVRRRFAPHQLRHAHAVEMSREGFPLLVIQRQLGPPQSRYHLTQDAGQVPELRYAGPRPHPPRRDVRVRAASAASERTLSTP